jgi:hypothetical protein
MRTCQTWIRSGLRRRKNPKVYGHILGQAGAFLDDILGPFIGGAAIMKDYVDYLRGKSSSAV